jgi:hypothetical protein
MKIKLMNRAIEVVGGSCEEYGYFDGSSKIVIRDGLQNGDRLDTLVHELFHAVFNVTGVSVSDEEKVVHTLATGLTTVMIDNPAFMSAIRQLANDAREELTR